MKNYQLDTTWWNKNSLAADWFYTGLYVTRNEIEEIVAKKELQLEL